MKRSEMITKIARYLDRSRTTVLMNGNEGKAKSLLTELEMWGMLPPDVCYKTDGTYDSKKNAAHFHMGRDLHYWEPEDAE